MFSSSIKDTTDFIVLINKEMNNFVEIQITTKLVF